MGLLGDEAQVEAWYGPFGDSATLDARLVHGLRQTYHRFINRFRSSETVGHKIVLDATDGTRK
jgi:hypothetical protein